MLPQKKHCQAVKGCSPIKPGFKKFQNQGSGHEVAAMMSVSVITLTLCK